MHIKHRTHVLDVHAVPDESDMLETPERLDIVDGMEGTTIRRFLRKMEVKIHA
jgi:hypothetical protein